MFIAKYCIYIFIGIYIHTYTYIHIHIYIVAISEAIYLIKLCIYVLVNYFGQKKNLSGHKHFHS
jgi:hypothetical protein